MKIIVAYTKENRVIGKGGAIPFYIKEDIQHFKETTLNSCVIMGRQTWLSLPNRTRPLPQRVNIILSSTMSSDIQRENSIYVRRNIGEVLDLIPILSLLRGETPLGVFIIGGQSIYEEFLRLNLVESIVASEIHKDYKGDRHFPALSGPWKKNLIRQFEEFDLVEYKKR